MSTFNTDIDKISYAMGMNLGETLKNMPVSMDPEMVIRGLRDAIADTPAMDEAEYTAAMRLYQRKMQSARSAAEEEASAANIAAGKKYLEENGARKEVTTTKSGLQYEVLTPGKGECPKATSRVRVHYVGTLIDGTEFDSSVRRGQPAEFALNQVIPGWTEGVQLMNTGAKFRFVIPSDLAYGARGAGNVIGPNATLIFQVELLAILS